MTQFIILVSGSYMSHKDTKTALIAEAYKFNDRHQADQNALEIAHDFVNQVVHVRRADTLSVMTTIIIHN